MRKTLVNLFHSPGRLTDASLLADRFRGIGIEVRLIRVVDGHLNQALTGTLYYFENSTSAFNTANQLSKLMFDIERTTPRFLEVDHAGVSYSVWLVGKSRHRGKAKPQTRTDKTSSTRTKQPASNKAKPQARSDKTSLPTLAKQPGSNKAKPQARSDKTSSPTLANQPASKAPAYPSNDRRPKENDGVRSSQVAGQVALLSPTFGELRLCVCIGADKNCRYCSGSGRISDSRFESQALAESSHSVTTIDKNVCDRNGAQMRLEGLRVTGPDRAIACVGKDFIARLWCLPNVSHRSEWDRRMNAIPRTLAFSHKETVLPHSLLALNDPYRGYLVRAENSSTTLSLVMDQPGGNASSVSSKGISLRSRLQIGAQLSSATSHLAKLGIARSAWDLEGILVSSEKTQTSIIFNDVENYCLNRLSGPVSRSYFDLMAPELMLEQRQPDSLSDAFSLAIILFLLIYQKYPFGFPGAQADPSVDFHINSHLLNEKVDEARSDQLLTNRLCDLFLKCFREGRYSRFRRPSASEWREACLLAIDRTLECNKCGSSFFPLVNVKKGERQFCFWCGDLIPSTCALLFFEATARVVGNVQRYVRVPRPGVELIVDPKGREVLGRHAHPLKTQLENKAVAMVHSQQDGVMLKNMSQEPFLFYTRDRKSHREILPGTSENIAIGSRVYFAKPIPGSVTRGVEIKPV